MTLAAIKRVLRSGPYAWPGGYPLYFITAQGDVLSFEAVRREWRQVVRAHFHYDRRVGWFIDAVDINWENRELYCDHTRKRIESAYAED